MAVEIPVVIDIDKAFAEAAKRVGAAMSPLQSAIDGHSIRANITIGNIDGANKQLDELNAYFRELEDADWEKVGSKLDLSPYINQAIMELRSLEKQINELQELRSMEGGGGDFSFAEEYKRLNSQVVAVASSIQALQGAQSQLDQTFSDSSFRSYVKSLTESNEELRKMREYYSELEDYSQKYASSINAIRGRVNALRAEYDAMTKAERQSEEGTIAYNKYKAEVKELRTEALTLDELLQKEQRRNELIQKGAQKRKYENAILSTTAKTMRVLQEQERILSERLSRTAFGSSKYQQLKTQLQGVRQEMERVNKELNGPALDNANSRMASLIKNSVRLIALHTGTRFIRNVREVTAEFELQKVALGSIIQDTERASVLFREIKAAAIESPFEIKDLVSYTKQLSAYQIETDKLFDTTMKLADVSAGLGVDMGRLILAYGQVRAAAVLRGQELRQFTEAGIPLVDKLAEKFTELRGETVKTGEVFQLISERAVPFKMIEEIFDDMTSAGEMFYKMQEKQAKTLAGQWSNLKDSVSIMYDEIGNTAMVHGAMEGLIQATKSIMENWRTWYNVVKIVGSGLVSYYGIAKLTASATNLMAAAETKAAAAESLREKSMRKFVTSLLGKTAAEKISTAGTNAYVWAAGKASAANGVLATTFWNLTAAMLSNPFGIAAVAIGSLIALLTTFSKKTRNIEDDITNANKAISSLNKTRSETTNLIDQYEELSSKTSLTSKESAKLRDISKELAKTFPKATEGISEQTNALSLNVTKLREYNDEAERAIRKGMEAQIRIDEKTVKKNDKEIEKITKELNRGWGRNKAVALLSPFILTPLSDKQSAELSDRLIELQSQNNELTDSIQNMKNALAGVPDKAGDAADSLLSWQDKLISFSREIGGATIRILDPEQIKEYSNLDEALEEIAKEYNKYKDQVEILEVALRGKNEEEAKDIILALNRAKARRDLAKEELDYYNAFSLTEKKTRSSKSDNRLQNLKNEISEIENAYKKFRELREYMNEAEALADIGVLFPQLKGWTPTYQNTIEKLGEMLDDVQAQLAKRPKDTVLLDMQRALETEISNLNFDKLKQDLEDSIKKLSDEIKRSETARDFYENILGLTGDEDLAATMSVTVYGGMGDEFKERMQKQLDAALNSLDWDQLDDATFGNISFATITQDFDTLLQYINLFPPEWREMLRKMASDNEKNNADWYTDFIKTFRKAKTYEERINTLQAQKQRKIDEARKMGMTQSDVDAVVAYFNREIADVQLEALKDTYTWTKAFEDLDSVSTQTLENLITLIDRYIDLYGQDLEPQQLKELTRSRDSAKQQIISRNAYVATGKAIKDVVAATRKLNKLQAEGKKDTEEGAKAADEQREALQRLRQALDQVFNDMDELVSKTKELMSVFASDDNSAYFSEQLDNMSKTLRGAGTAAIGIAQLLSGAITPEAIMQSVSGLADVVSGVFGGINAKQVRDANKEYDEQAKLLKTLDRSYDQLEKSIGEAFGNDYVYRFNQQLEVLQAQYNAYIAQAENREEAAQKESTKKNRKRYAEEAEEARAQAMDVQHTIDSLRYEASQKFAGADLSSAAESFADAWLSAYQEFGDTSTAIEERMTEMVQTLMKKAALSGIAQNILGNWYSSLADVKDWNAQTIAEKWKEAMALVNPMVEGMQVFANSMQAEGVPLRNTVGQFTGISRDIAGASEESINGLAAGINTQNFYMSFMPMISENVAQILTYMTGGNTVTPATQTGIEGMPSVQTIVYNNLPAIRSDIGDLLQLMKSVISVGNVAPRNYVAIK